MDNARTPFLQNKLINSSSEIFFSRHLWINLLSSKSKKIKLFRFKNKFMLKDKLYLNQNWKIVFKFNIQVKIIFKFNHQILLKG